MSIGAAGSAPPKANLEGHAGRRAVRAELHGSPSVAVRALCAGALAWHVSACENPKYVDRELDGGQTGVADAKPPSNTRDGGTAGAGSDGARSPGDGPPSAPSGDRDDAGGKPGDALPAEAGTASALPSTPAGTDAGTALPGDPGGLPDWAEPLVGTYAKRSTDFSYDDAPTPPINTRNVEHSIVKVINNGGVLEWTSQLCSYVVSIKGSTGTPPLNFPNAAGMPPLRGRLVLGAAGSFSSAPMLQHLGFDPARGTGCDAGNRRPKFDDQTWIGGASCTCYTTSLPEHIDDCRVVDGDGDGKPGVIARGPSPLGTTVSNYAMVFDYSVSIVDGKVRPDRTHQLRELRVQEPACINIPVDNCSFGNNQLCPGGTTRLLPVDDTVSCAMLNTGDFGPPEPFPVETNCRSTP